jgi:hypothetical protein
VKNREGGAQNQLAGDLRWSACEVLCGLPGGSWLVPVASLALQERIVPLQSISTPLDPHTRRAKQKLSLAHTFDARACAHTPAQAQER